MEFEFFKTFDESITAFENFLPNINLTTEETPMEEATDFCKSALVILGKSEDVLKNINFDQQNQFIEILKNKGCVSCKEASEKFTRGLYGKSPLSSYARNDIYYPLTIFSSLLNETSNPIFKSVVNSIFNSKDYIRSGMHAWLETQGINDPNAYFNEIKSQSNTME